MKRRFLYILSAVLLCPLISMAGCAEKQEPRPDTAGYDTKLLVSESANKFACEGFATEWDAHFFTVANQKQGVTEEDFKMIERRIQAMRLKRVRTMYTPAYCEITEGNFNFETMEMKSLVRQLEVCQRNNIEVVLSCHGIPSAYWNAFPGTNTWSAPKSIDAYTNNISKVLNYLINEKKFTCIRYYNPYNEPNLFFNMTSDQGWIRTPAEFQYYVEMVKKLDARLKQDGLRDKIKLIIGDESENLEYMHDVAKELGGIGDVLSSHNYAFTAETPAIEIENWAKGTMNYKDEFMPEKPHYVYEIGNKNYSDAYHVFDVNEFSRGFYLPKVAITYMNEGGTGISYWVLFDQLYYDGPIEAAKMSMGLFGFKDENWQLRPTYQAWALMSRYVSRNAKVYKTTTGSSTLSGVTFVNPDGSHTYFVCNSGKTEDKFFVDNPDLKNASMTKYVFDKDSCHSQEEILPSSGTVDMKQGIFMDTIGPETFAVYTDITFKTK